MADVLSYVGIGLAILAVLLYLRVAKVIQGRPVSDAAQNARRAFVAWWGGLAAITAIGIVFNDVTGLALTELSVEGLLVAYYVILVVYFAMTAALVYYLLYLYTGSNSIGKLSILLFLALMGFLAFFLHGFGGSCYYPSNAECVQPDGWVADPDDPDEHVLSSYEARPAWVGQVFVLLFAGPPLIGAMLYGALYFRVPDATSKYRVACIAIGIFLFFAFSILSSFLGGGSSGNTRAEALALFGQALGLVSALLVLAAYHPPKWVQKKWGVRALEVA